MSFLILANAEKMLEESREDFMARIKDAFQAEFDQQVEQSAMWIGIADPYYGDMYFLLENDELVNRANNADDYYKPATMEQHFDIGSISKTFGGTSVLLMVERGDLALSDTISELIPDFAAQFPEYADYTVEELLRMKTTVPDFLNDEEGKLISTVWFVVAYSCACVHIYQCMCVCCHTIRTETSSIFVGYGCVWP